MSDFWFAILLVLGAYIGGVAIGVAVVSDNYDRGYCAALGGECLTAGTCNVNGQVVEVK